MSPPTISEVLSDLSSEKFCQPIFSTGGGQAPKSAIHGHLPTCQIQTVYLRAPVLSTVKATLDVLKNKSDGCRSTRRSASPHGLSSAADSPGGLNGKP